MKFGIRIIACIAMMAIALTMVVFTAADFRQVRGDSFVLREHSGRVAVFSGADNDEPLAITDIELENLPSSDRNKLSSGIVVSGEDSLLKLLEDLGS
ncbi:MAG: hypothetical protein E7420_05560 [Ruminococcaceae bacterium]|nr:hypothetical protein [Oscillospiraceae bacterium]